MHYKAIETNKTKPPQTPICTVHRVSDDSLPASFRASLQCCACLSHNQYSTTTVSCDSSTYTQICTMYMLVGCASRVQTKQTTHPKNTLPSLGERSPYSVSPHDEDDDDVKGLYVGAPPWRAEAAAETRLYNSTWYTRKFPPRRITANQQPTYDDDGDDDAAAAAAAVAVSSSAWGECMIHIIHTLYGFAFVLKHSSSASHRVVVVVGGRGGCGSGDILRMLCARMVSVWDQRQVLIRPKHQRTNQPSPSPPSGMRSPRRPTLNTYSAPHRFHARAPSPILYNRPQTTWTRVNAARTTGRHAAIRCSVNGSGLPSLGKGRRGEEGAQRCLM